MVLRDCDCDITFYVAQGCTCWSSYGTGPFSCVGEVNYYQYLLFLFPGSHMQTIFDTYGVDLNATTKAIYFKLNGIPYFARTDRTCTIFNILNEEDMGWVDFSYLSSYYIYDYVYWPTHGTSTFYSGCVCTGNDACDWVAHCPCAYELINMGLEDVILPITGSITLDPGSPHTEQWDCLPATVNISSSVCFVGAQAGFYLGPDTTCGEWVGGGDCDPLEEMCEGEEWIGNISPAITCGWQGNYTHLCSHTDDYCPAWGAGVQGTFTFADGESVYGSATLWSYHYNPGLDPRGSYPAAYACWDGGGMPSETISVMGSINVG